MKKFQLLLLVLVAAAVVFTGCNQSSKNKAMVKKELYGTYKCY
jgi:predicted component of type VI protein secretion system